MNALAVRPILAWLDHAALLVDRDYRAAEAELRAAVEDAEAEVRAAKRDLAFSIVEFCKEGWAR
jgi:F0F1-type ATP synthase membrane subunit b/b'